MPNILIVDDSTFARSNIHRIFSDAGYQVMEAASGQSALELVETQYPNLVTLDLLMPGMSGLETLLKLCTKVPDTKNIVISANIQSATRDELIAAGADAFLNKPVSRTELLSVAAKLTGQV
jgi:two-component system, chemotaxis family, chemotaxis protein CheY